MFCNGHCLQFEDHHRVVQLKWNVQPGLPASLLWLLIFQAKCTKKWCLLTNMQSPQTTARWSWLLVWASELNFQKISWGKPRLLKTSFGRLSSFSSLASSVISIRPGNQQTDSVWNQQHGLFQKLLCAAICLFADVLWPWLMKHTGEAGTTTHDQEQAPNSIWTRTGWQPA